MRRILSETQSISASRSNSPLAYWPAWIVAAAGAAMLIYWLQTARPLWVDEEMLALNARDRGLAQLGTPLYLDQSAPLGWLVLERFAIATLGTSEPAVRSVNTLFGIAMLVTAAWIGRRWMTPVGAVVLVLLCATGEWLIFFVLELKHYSADAFGTLLLIAVAARAVDAGDGDAGDRSGARGGMPVARSRQEQCGDSPTARSALRARTLVWWVVAAVALWFSNGALFVTPGIAVALLAMDVRRRDWTAVRATIGGGAIWLASFALAYVLLLRHTLDNPFLKNYWAFAFPPRDAGLGATVAWTAGLLQPFALKPSGTTFWVPFWIAVAAGIGYATAAPRRGRALHSAGAARSAEDLQAHAHGDTDAHLDPLDREPHNPTLLSQPPHSHALVRERTYSDALGWIVATVPVSAVLLALAHVVPPFERLAIWVVPALYVAVALCADAAVRLAAPAPRSDATSSRVTVDGRSNRTIDPSWSLGTRSKRATNWLLALGFGAVAGMTCVNVVQRGYRALQVRPQSNYGLDDRRSIRWLLSSVRPGDVVLTTHFGLAAIWWYGGIDISKTGRIGHLPGDIPLLEVGHEPPGPDCARREQELRAALAGRSRVVVYLGFRLNVLPPGFDYLVLEELGKRGDLVGYQRYAEESRLAVFDLARLPAHTLVIPGEAEEPNAIVPTVPTAPRAAAGCLTVTPAARW